MKSKPIVLSLVSLIAAAALASACASPDARYGNNELRSSSVRPNESYYAVVDSIESRPSGIDGGATVSPGAYSIRVRYDDRTYQTVTQTALDGLRVGDSVRIESDRVRRY